MVKSQKSIFSLSITSKKSYGRKDIPLSRNTFKLYVFSLQEAHYVKPECKPIQQKLRRIKPEMLLKIKEKIRKHLNLGFLKVAKYPEWVAYIVLVPKKDGKVWMCVDYKDLNLANPKDNFLIPLINTLIDNTAKNTLFSFMDGFSI